MSLPYMHPYTGISTGLQPRQVPDIGGWVELARNTLGSPGTSCNVTGLADKRYYMVLTSILDTAINGYLHRLNGASGSQYSGRTSGDGAADSTYINRSNMSPQSQATSTPKFEIGYISNLATAEKQCQWWSTVQNALGAGTAPGRYEIVNKFNDATNPISSIQTEITMNNFPTGTEVVVLGWDPDDTHENNFWSQLASVNASGSSTNLSSGTITAKKYLWIQSYLKNTTSHTSDMTFNNDTTTYAYRNSDNGAADSTSTSQAEIEIYSATTTPVFSNMFIINNSANEKLVIGNVVNQHTAGAGTAPNRREFVGKYDNTGAQITEIDIDSSAGNWHADSIINVWGAD